MSSRPHKQQQSGASRKKQRRKSLEEKSLNGLLQRLSKPSSVILENVYLTFQLFLNFETRTLLRITVTLFLGFFGIWLEFRIDYLYGF